ncbi:hypothetical protein CI105_03905 [Candidatus Izimaplasma bacterium ZiA1]|uniref:6-phosphofructokinase n=1 Tax=Candidatus Izimoplasma sp. ZiA1 TaxID=2024899 RepID=UPI000BAA7633|nr:hypothetical protein CI105_03905 [Candidatus Izimaplasma bacterium ZiA1]
MLKGNLIYGQSGGPSSVINASAYGVISEALKSDLIENVLVMKNGISGILNNEYYVENDFIEDLELLKNTPASAFGSVRYKLKSYIEDIHDFEIIHDFFKNNNIRYFLYNGGNDSMDTCVKLSEYMNHVDYDVKIIGIPKTIDNDLPSTDHTPGFGSAAKYIINTLMEINRDMAVYPRSKVTIVEIMGRHAGWLTASSMVAKQSGTGPDLIYVPEVAFDIDDFLVKVENIYNKKQSCLIAVSEGIKDHQGYFVGLNSDFKDAFGHNQLGGVAMKLGELVKAKLKIDYRSIELSTTQRAASHLRSKTDVLEAIEVGRHGVLFALQGYTNKMVTINRTSNKDYHIEYGIEDTFKIANKEQVIPNHMFDENNNLNDEFYRYILPLINGEYPQIYENGVQKFFKIKQ